MVSHACDIKRGSNVFCDASYNACNGSDHTHCLRIMLLSCSYCAAKTQDNLIYTTIQCSINGPFNAFYGEFFTSEVTEMSLDGHDSLLLD